MIANDQVCAVVVSYNRKALLAECIAALLGQSRPVSRILVIDNASTDGTGDLFRSNGDLAASNITYIQLPVNVGGAGGFHEGVKRGFEQQGEWLWLLDDDTIATPTALEELFAARARFPEGSRPDLLASKVKWTDGSMHPMNVPRLKRNDMLESAVRAAEQGTISIRASSFVSLLVHRRLVAEHGLPIADYFIWNDDVEYTARILRKEFGVLVPQSVVVHKTAKKQAPAGDRFYYAVRNQLWMVTRSTAWTTEERWRVIGGLVAGILSYFSREGITWRNVQIVWRGALHGLTRRPARQLELQGGE